MGERARQSEVRFAAYIGSLASVLGHVDRVGPLNDYCVGLLMPGERKSVEPMAAIVAPARTAAEHQSLLHFVGQSRWSDEAMLAKVRELATPALEAHGGIEAWIIDDTGFQKKGSHSVGVTSLGGMGRSSGDAGKETLAQGRSRVLRDVPELWSETARPREVAHPARCSGNVAENDAQHKHINAIKRRCYGHHEPTH